MNKFLHVVLAGAFVVFSASISAAEIKIGVVQFERIQQEAPQTADVIKKLEREFLPKQQELERMAKQIKDQEAALDKDSLTMSENDRRNRERDVANMKLDFQRKQREVREDMNLRRNDELSGLVDRVNKAIASVAEAEGYDLVLYSGVAYANTKKIDITDKVLKALGKK